MTSAIPHIRTKPSKASPLFCSGGPAKDQFSLPSASLQKAKADKFKGYCKRCIKVVKSKE